MNRLFQKGRQGEKGQGMTEYVIILALVAIAAIKVVQLFGDTVKVKYGEVAQKLQGKASYSGTKINELTDIDDATKSTDLSDFNQ